MELLSLLLQFIVDLAWPIATLTVAWIFRKEIKGAIRQLEGLEAGQVKVNLANVAKAEVIRAETQSNEVIAKRFLEQKVVDDRELRILRGLVGETNGRSLNDYRRSGFYRPALDSLLAKHLIENIHHKFHLTQLGTEVVTAHLRAILNL